MSFKEEGIDISGLGANEIELKQNLAGAWSRYVGGVLWLIFFRACVPF